VGVGTDMYVSIYACMYVCIYVSMYMYIYIRERERVSSPSRDHVPSITQLKGTGHNLRKGNPPQTGRTQLSHTLGTLHLFVSPPILLYASLLIYHRLKEKETVCVCVYTTHVHL
jgi:hypothetical protein